MADRVVTRKQPVLRKGISDFPFTAGMVPSSDGAEFARAYRHQAWSDFERIPMPTTQDEPWRRTDLRGLEADTFRLADIRASERLPPVPGELLLPLTEQGQGGRLVLLPGSVHAEMSPELRQTGTIFADLITSEREHPDVLERILGKVIRTDEGKFAALAGALAGTGALVYVPPGVHVEQPLHSLLWGSGERLAYFSHLLIYLDEGASLTYIHEAASPTHEGNQTLHAGLVEVIVEAGAALKFVDLQSWGKHVWNFTHERIRVAEDGHLDWIIGTQGSKVTKNFATLDLIAPGATAQVSGFYFVVDHQHVDLDTQQNHLAPDTTSDLQFKGALNGKSRAIWQGMIHVAPGAQNADGYQANRNLVLSEEARADSIPGLEILADDVRCTHGATVGKIDPDHLFYILSRGVPKVDAILMIIDGFFDPIMERIPFEGMRERLKREIIQKMV
ncbi:MAG: Fe-S cluster assembly protein SufD [Chloroflexota bacterium]